MGPMGMKYRFLLGASLALLPLASASAETLAETLAKAYQTNPDLAAQRANLRATDESQPQAVAQRRPTITG